MAAEDKLSDEQAAAMLHALTKHFGQPVLPVKQYCDALEIWAGAIIKLKQKGDKYGQGSEYADVLPRIMTDIRKSNFLARLIYEGEKLRTIECPEHKGKLSMGFFQNPCPHGCDYTGWLPAK